MENFVVHEKFSKSSRTVDVTHTCAECTVYTCQIHMPCLTKRVRYKAPGLHLYVNIMAYTPAILFVNPCVASFLF
jgi:hypothetical protein